MIELSPRCRSRAVVLLGALGAVMAAGPAIGVASAEQQRPPAASLAAVAVPSPDATPKPGLLFPNRPADATPEAAEQPARPVEPQTSFDDPPATSPPTPPAQPQTTTIDSVPTSADSDDGVPLPLLVALLVLVAALAAAGGRLSARRQPAPAGAGPLPVMSTSGPAAADRRALVEACIEVRDVIPSTALRSRLGQALAAAGVVELDPAGEPFDPQWHQAVGAAATSDPAMRDRIAATDRVGYSDRGTPVRRPEVTVYQVSGPA